MNKDVKANTAVVVRLKSLPSDKDVIFSSKSKDASYVSLSTLNNNKVGEISGVHSKDNVQKALKLMRRVEIPPIRTEHNYSPKKIFGAVSSIPLEKISQIKKSAHISLHERRIREHKLTPYQTEILSSFDKGPRRIEVDLVAAIVAEEEQAIAIRKKNKINQLKKKAWGANAPLPGDHNPETAFFDDDLESLCTSMSFSTANISNLHEDVFDIEIDHNIGNEQKIPLTNQNTNKKRLSRTRSQVERNRERHIQEEAERKKSMILKKRAKTIIKKEKSEIVIKQQMWLHLVAHFARAHKILQVVAKYRSHATQIRQARLREQAMFRIIIWYRDYSLRRKMKLNQAMLVKIRIRFAMYLRKRRVKVRRDAANILTHFICCVNGSSIRTQKLYRFRSRVIKVQTVFGQFYKCQRARLQLLYLAFQRELHQARLERNQVKTNRERISMRSMRRTPFFGEAVQKLDDICSNLTNMITRRNIINNLKMKQLQQLQNESERKRANSHSHKSILGSRAQSSGRHQYETILKRVLGNQRKRHILSQKGVDHAHKSFATHQAVDPKEVKEFLKTPGHAGPTYVILDHRDLENKRKNTPLILLTGGAIHELRDIAKSIVAEEDEETMNFEIQKTLLGEYGQDDEYF